MNDQQRAAMQMAKDTLIDAQQYYGSFDLGKEALAAIDEALAQSEIDLINRECRYTTPLMDESLAQPQGYPFCGMCGNQPCNCPDMPMPTNRATPPVVPQGEPLTDTFVQTVPDKCDRIVWRNRYYHLERFDIVPQEPVACWCRTCRPITLDNMRFVVCPDCGNKRCPKANDHRHGCTNSNEPGQKGSAYEHTTPPAVEAMRIETLEKIEAMAIEWGNARQDDHGGHALRNFAEAIRSLQ